MSNSLVNAAALSGDKRTSVDMSKEGPCHTGDTPPECPTPPMPECWPETQSVSTVPRKCSEESFTPPPSERRAKGLWDIENLGTAALPPPPPEAPPLTPRSDRPTKKYRERSGLTELEVAMQGKELRPAALMTYFNRNLPEDPTPQVLEPDHPFMARFQVSLKQHLLRQLEKLNSDIFELDTDIKKKEKEREEFGMSLYGAQQDVFRQQKTLEGCQDTLEHLMKEREETESKLKAKRLKYKEHVDMTNQEKKKEDDMLLETAKLGGLERQLAKWEGDMDSDLAVNQRIAEKTEIDRKQMIEEKRKMDMYMLQVMTEVSKFEHELSALKAEIDVKLEEKNVVNQSVADATADLQALIAEQRRLFGAWNSIIVTMGQRDAIYSNIVKDLHDCQEAFRSLTSEIESYKRSAVDESRKNEQLAIIFGRVQVDYDSAEQALKMLLEKKAIMEHKLASVIAMLAETEKELQLAKIETASKESQLAAIRQELEKHLSEKRKIEDEMLILLQDQMTNDKAAIHLNRLVRDTRDKTRQAELAMVDLENKIAKRFLEVEEYKGLLARNAEILAEMNKTSQDREDQLKDIEATIHKIIKTIMGRQNDMMVINKKIDKQLERSGTKLGQSPVELKVLELEKLNEEYTIKNDKLQSFWLTQQNNHVKLTRQRDEQLKEIQILRKQVVIMVQRTLKTEMELEKEMQMAAEVARSIASLQHRLAVLNATLSGRKDYKEQLDKNNTFAQSLFLQALKESELEQVRLKSETCELESQLEELAEAMLEKQREMLAWEKKIKLAIETKASIQKERQPTGEVGQMKMEIHRMEVRYGQLKRAQEKLITDLENCVIRRDAILDGADAREKKAARGFNNRFTFQKKLEDMRNKIKQLQSEQRNVERIIQATEEGHQDLLNQMNEKTEQLKKLEETSREMDLQLEDGLLHKQQNLETLVRRQKKCRLYNSVKGGKHRLLYRNEIVLETETSAVKSTNDKLVSVLESLLQDFPGYRFQLCKIYNLVRAKPA